VAKYFLSGRVTPGVVWKWVRRFRHERKWSPYLQFL
jgi:hypothetical protein